MTSTSSPSVSPWPHRWAVVLACATFPLVWVGGLVTTTDAGMAVPDWPNTYGYNLLLYPWQTWLAGPWDLFIEHGHRLLATAVGLLTIGLLVSLWRSDGRRWVCRLGVAALLLVVLQGVLGGMRVVLAERGLAMVHGFTGPLFFGLTVVLVVVTSESWRRGSSTGGQAASGTPSSYPNPLPRGEGMRIGAVYLQPLVVLTAVLIYLQIMVGAVLRHAPVATEPTTFALAVQFHLLLAAVLLLHVAVVNWSILRHVRDAHLVRWLAVALGGLTILQVVLGAATWLAKYAVPFWLDRWLGPAGVTIEADGWLQTHAAVGSLLFGTAIALTLYVLRATARHTVAPAALGTREASV
jgi:cytochrome c oxidase assembly protein subunit 15